MDLIILYRGQIQTIAISKRKKHINITRTNDNDRHIFFKPSWLIWRLLNFIYYWMARGRGLANNNNNKAQRLRSYLVFSLDRWSQLKLLIYVVQFNWFSYSAIVYRWIISSTKMLQESNHLKAEYMGLHDMINIMIYIPSASFSREDCERFPQLLFLMHIYFIFPRSISILVSTGQI